MVREIIENLENRLNQHGLHRNHHNFRLDAMPAAVDNFSYAIANLTVVPKYFPGQNVLYNSIELTLLVLCKVFGPHNLSATAGEGYMLSLDVFERIETIILCGIESGIGEDLQIASASLQPMQGGNPDEYLVWQFRLKIDSSRQVEE
jgi:hypothetical protein